jgi:hypothetical protein
MDRFCRRRLTHPDPRESPRSAPPTSAPHRHGPDRHRPDLRRHSPGQSARPAASVDPLRPSAADARRVAHQPDRAGAGGDLRYQPVHRAPSNPRRNGGGLGPVRARPVRQQRHRRSWTEPSSRSTTRRSPNPARTTAARSTSPCAASPTYGTSDWLTYESTLSRRRRGPRGPERRRAVPREAARLPAHLDRVRAAARAVVAAGSG